MLANRLYNFVTTTTTKPKSMKLYNLFIKLTIKTHEIKFLMGKRRQKKSKF